MKLKPTISTFIITVALFTGMTSAAGGYLVNRAADKKVCHAKLAENVAVRGLLDDLIAQNPHVTVKQRKATDAIALKRFPNHC